MPIVAKLDIYFGKYIIIIIFRATDMISRSLRLLFYTRLMAY